MRPTSDQRAMMRFALGLTNTSFSCQNHYVPMTPAGHAAWMELYMGGFAVNNGAGYSVTRAGLEAVIEPGDAVGADAFDAEDRLLAENKAGDRTANHLERVAALKAARTNQHQSEDTAK